MFGRIELLHGCFRATVKRRKPTKPGSKAGPHAHVDTTNKCLNTGTRRLLRTRRTINVILLTAQLLVC
jgi:hypothetical protein